VEKLVFSFFMYGHHDFDLYEAIYTTRSLRPAECALLKT